MRLRPGQRPCRIACVRTFLANLQPRAARPGCKHRPHVRSPHENCQAQCYTRRARRSAPCERAEHTGRRHRRCANLRSHRQPHTSADDRDPERLVGAPGSTAGAHLRPALPDSAAPALPPRIHRCAAASLRANAIAIQAARLPSPLAQSRLGALDFCFASTSRCQGPNLSPHSCSVCWPQVASCWPCAQLSCTPRPGSASATFARIKASLSAPS